LLFGSTVVAAHRQAIHGVGNLSFMPNQQHKQDTGKPAFELIPPHALREVAKVMEFGARKYGPNTWSQVDAQRYLAAAYRHINAHHIGMGEDKESGIDHLAHAIVNLMFILEKRLCKTSLNHSLERATHLFTPLPEGMAATPFSPKPSTMAEKHADCPMCNSGK